MSELTAENYFEKEDCFNWESNNDPDNEIDNVFCKKDMILFAEKYYKEKSKVNDTTKEEGKALHIADVVCRAGDYVRENGWNTFHKVVKVDGKEIHITEDGDCLYLSDIIEIKKA